MGGDEREGEMEVGGEGKRESEFLRQLQLRTISRQRRFQ